jgi:hypothetical protein
LVLLGLSWAVWGHQRDMTIMAYMTCAEGILVAFLGSVGGISIGWVEYCEDPFFGESSRGNSTGGLMNIPNFDVCVCVLLVVMVMWLCVKRIGIFLRELVEGILPELRWRM